jgi:hypothetical protein
MIIIIKMAVLIFRTLWRAWFQAADQDMGPRVSFHLEFKCTDSLNLQNSVKLGPKQYPELIGYQKPDQGFVVSTLTSLITLQITVIPTQGENTVKTN